MNILFGAALSFYSFFNVAISSLVLVLTGLLLYLINTIKLKDAYKISLMLTFSLTGFLKYVLSVLAPHRIADNWWLIFVSGIMAMEIILLIVTNIVSNKVK